MIQRDTFTRHALDRSTSRDIPIRVVELILDYGDSAPARGGARRHALDKQALRQIRRDFGRRIAKAVAEYRSAQVISAEGRIITVLRSNRPIFH